MLKQTRFPDAKFLQDTCYEEYQRMVASELTLRSDCHDSRFQNHPDSVHYITKMPVAFKPELQTQFGAYVVIIFNPYAFF